MPPGGDLPKNVLSPTDLGTDLQNLNATKVKAKSQNNMSSGFLGSSGGLAGGVVTTVGNLFGGFMGDIADDASSTTVENPEDVEEQVEGFFSNPATKLFDAFLGLFSPILQGLTSGLSGAALSLANLFGLRWAQVDDIAEVQVPRLDNRIDSLAGIGTRSTFYINGTWTNPGTGTIAVAVFNGGRRTGDVAREVSGARYVFQEFNCADLPATVAVTVGGPNAASSFGTFLMGSWENAAIVTSQGLFDGSAGDAGMGGEASNASGATLESRTGTGNYFAAGGMYETGTTRAVAGQDAPIDKVALAGGGGGGGGGFSFGGTVAQKGANGGFPGGGAGQRPNSTVSLATPGSGGVFITLKG